MIDFTVQAGLTEDGFFDIVYSDLYEVCDQAWLRLTGKHLKEGKPEDDMLHAVMERLANRDLVDQTGLSVAMWSELLKVFYSAYVPTAFGTALDYAVQYRDLYRFPALYATGYIIVKAAPGTVIPLGAELKKDSDENVSILTTRAVTVGPLGETAIPVVAATAGTLANSAELTFSSFVNAITGVTEVSNKDASTKYTLGGIVDSWYSLAPDGNLSNFHNLSTDQLRYAAKTKSVKITFKNPQTTSKLFDVQLIFYNDANGAEIARTPVSFLQMAAEETREVLFDNLNLDFFPYPNVRMVVVNHPTSEAAIEVGLNTVGGSGGWTPLGLPDVNKNMWFEISQGVSGEIINGTDVEDDDSLKSRYFNVRFNAAGATPNGLFSKVSMIPGVRGVRVYFNSANVPRQVAPGLTLASKSYHVVVDGGDPVAIAQALYDSGAGLFSEGSVTILVTGTNGVVEPIQFSFASRIFIRVVATLTRDNTFVSTSNEVKNVIIDKIGGFDSLGALKSGYNIGESVSHGELVEAVMGIAGVKDVDLKLAVNGTPVLEAPVQIAALNKSWTDLSIIQVV